MHQGGVATSTTKNVLLTGASGGVGSALTGRLADLGWRVFAGVRTYEAGQTLAKLGPTVEPVELDITDEDSVAAAARRITDAVGAEGLHGL